MILSPHQRLAPPPPGTARGVSAGYHMPVGSTDRLVRGNPGSVAKANPAAVDQDREPTWGKTGARGRGGRKIATGSETAHNFSEMTVAKVSMFEDDCGYRRLFEQVDLLAFPGLTAAPPR
jgi:hypothetical protein